MIPLYGSANILIAALVAISREAVAARDESEKKQAELQLAHRQLQDYTERAEELAVLQERNRLARELHDAVTQTLFSASLIAEALPALWERDQEKGRERLAMLRQMSRGALAEMRTLLLELRPAAVAETSLEDLLGQLGEAVAGREGVPVSVEVDGSCELPADLHVALYRIAQEALSNVVKHAKASQVAVSLRCVPCEPSPDSGEGEGVGVKVELVISDDGRGFDPDDAPPEHMGLGIMRERAEAVGAQLGIVSQPGRGTQVTVVWPGDEG
jgi:signal transduction histidine kinase